MPCKKYLKVICLFFVEIIQNKITKFNFPSLGPHQRSLTSDGGKKVIYNI